MVRVDKGFRYRHPILWKANVVADALSRKSIHSVNAFVVYEELCKYMQRLNLEIVSRECLEGVMHALTIQPYVFDEWRIVKLEM